MKQKMSVDKSVLIHLILVRVYVLSSICVSCWLLGILPANPFGDEHKSLSNKYDKSLRTKVHLYED